MRFPVILAAAAVLAGCVPAARTPAPDPVRAAAPVLAPAPPPVDWRDRPATPGTWTYRRQDRGRSVASYGQADAAFALRLVCDPGSRSVTMSMAGAPGARPVTVRTSSVTRTLPAAFIAQADARPPFTHDIRLGADDPLLDAIAFSRGRFVVEQAGTPALVVPAWPEIGRVIEDCRG
jgi:hypothetical protein